MLPSFNNCDHLKASVVEILRHPTKSQDVDLSATKLGNLYSDRIQIDQVFYITQAHMVCILKLSYIRLELNCQPLYYVSSVYASPVLD